jgi:hypothetical protein
MYLLSSWHVHGGRGESFALIEAGSRQPSKQSYEAGAVLTQTLEQGTTFTTGTSCTTYTRLQSSQCAEIRLEDEELPVPHDRCFVIVAGSETEAANGPTVRPPDHT